MDAPVQFDINEIYNKPHHNPDYLAKYAKYLGNYSLIEYKVDVHNSYDLKLEQFYRLTGRIVAKRNMGKLIFVSIYNYGSQLQLIFSRNSTLEFVLLNNITRGDIICVEGTAGLSNTKVLSLFVNKWGLISKTIMEHPDKVQGIKDLSTYKSKRYLQYIYDNKLNYNLRIRAKALSATRQFFSLKQYLEIDTPILSSTYGGAVAKPFTTQLAETKELLYLSIAPEFKLKDLVFGGFDKVYTITHSFRNEGIDKTHHPEFTSVEFYAQNVDYIAICKQVMELFKYVTYAVKNTYTVLYNTHSIRMDKYTIIKYVDLLDQYYPNRSVEMLQKALHEVDEIVDGLTLEYLEFKVFESLITPRLIQPTCVIDYPAMSTPLAKYNRKNDKYVEQCEIYVAGMELANLYSEENTVHALCSKPVKTSIDHLHVDMLAYGQYIHAGAGFGFDRFIMVLANETDVRKTIYCTL